MRGSGLAGELVGVRIRVEERGMGRRWFGKEGIQAEADC